MTKLRIATFFAVLLTFGGIANAETVAMAGTSAQSTDGHPARGMTQQRVEAKYGSPVSIQAAVGEPPITRWVYQDFVVYFEHDKVIHAVAKR